MAQNNFLNQIMGGGACNPDGSQQMSHSSNPVRNFFNSLIYDKSKMRQQMGGFYPEEAMMQHPEHFDKQWELMAQQMDKAHISEAEMHKMMQEQWFNEQRNFEEMRRMQEFQEKKAWEEAQFMAAKHEKEQMMADKFMSEQWKDAKINAAAHDWENDYLKEYGMEKEFEDAFKAAREEVEGKKDEEQVVKESANYMVDVLENDPDPRFQNSKLLALLKKLQTGEYQIKDNQLIQQGDLNSAWEGAKEEVKMDKAWEHAHMDKAWAEEEHKIEARPQGDEETEKVFDKIWKKMQAGEFASPEEAELDEEYKKIIEQMEKAGEGNMEDIFADMWNVEQDIQEYQAYGDIDDKYQFGGQNPFENEAKPLELASNLLNEGDIKSAIMALEAHLQKHPNDSNSWRVLGKLHMDNDEDRRAVRCFLNSINIDPTNLDNLLALGVSCTNILDEVQAMNHLKHWMMNNPKYKHMGTDPNMIPETLVGKSITMEEIKAMNHNILNHFEQARASNPQDPELATSLAVLYFIARDYKASVSLFNEALKYDTNNYSLWNKLGATLAHLGRADEAVEAYNRALEFKPNYVRAWVNLGIAHAYRGDFDDAARFYLSALSMNPGAEHVWSYLQTTLMSLQRYDLLKLIAERNLEGFKKEFDIVLASDLPPPEIEYRQLNEQFLVKQKAENWTAEFNQM